MKRKTVLVVALLGVLAGIGTAAAVPKQCGWSGGWWCCFDPETNTAVCTRK